MTVLFSSEGVCPSCGIAGDQPVTDKDLARIVAIHTQDRRQATKSSEVPALGMGMIVMGVLVIVLTAGTIIPIGLLFVGVRWAIKSQGESRRD